MLLAVLLLGTAAAYAPVRGFGFVYDDGEGISENSAVAEGLSAKSLVWAFTTTDQCNWMPLTWLSHLLNVSVFGLDPGPHHLVNLVLHLLNVFLLFIFLQALTQATWPNLAITAIFALHPLHVESVAWVTERKDLLSTFFWLLALLAYLRHLRQGRGFFPLLATGAFLCSLMSKPMAVTFPFLLLLLDVWPLGRLGAPAASHGRSASWRSILAEKAPFVVLAVASSVMTIYAQWMTISSLRQYTLLRRLLNIPLTYTAYLGKAIWPAGLSVFYPLGEATPAAAAVAASLLLLAGITGVALFALRRRPYLLCGWLWYLGTLVPVIGFVQVGDIVMADRYTYVPLIGISVMLCYGCADFVRHRVRRAAAATLAGLILALALGEATRFQVSFWRSNRTLFDRALAVSPDNWLAHTWVGREDTLGNDIPAGIRHLSEVVRLEPDYADGRLNLGLLFLRSDRLDQAEVQLQAAANLRPTHAKTLLNLGVVLYRQGRKADAAEYFEKALRAQPDYPQARNNLAAVLAELGRTPR